MKKVLIVSNYSGYYGSEKMLSYVVDSLIGQYDVSLVLNAHPKFSSEIGDRYNCNTFVESFNVLSKKNKSVSFKSMLFWFRTIKSLKPDLVIVNISLVPEVIFLSKLLGTPVFVFVRESLIDYKKMFSIYRLFLRFTSTRIVCNSLYTLSMFGSHPKNILLPDVVQLNSFKGLSSNHSQVSTITFTYVGRLSERKGVIDLLDAISILENSSGFNSDIVINIIGDYKESDSLYYNNLKKKALSIKSNVKFFGYLDDPSSVVSESSFSVCPSKLPETFGLTVLESMIQGVPVIARDVGAYSELVHNGENGILFNDTESLALALGDAISLSSDDYYKMKKYCVLEARKYTLESYKERINGEVESVIYSDS